MGGVEIGGDGAGGGVAHGVIVGGVPIGEPAFVAEHMRREADEIVSYIQKTVTQLHDSPHALWAALYYSAQHKFDYWLRHMPPAEVGDAAARIDAAMIQAVEAVSYVGMCGDGYARRRVHLPARMRGCGIRSLTMLAPIAYCACFIESAEVMLDGSVGVVAAGGGFFNMLAPTFGVGAFDVGGHRFATYVQGVTPSAASFRDAWRALRRFVAGENPVDDMPDRDTSPLDARRWSVRVAWGGASGCSGR